MVHISQVAHERIDKVSDKIKVDDIVKVKVIDVDKEKNRISLSMKELLPRPSRDDNDKKKKTSFF